MEAAIVRRNLDGRYYLRIRIQSVVRPTVWSGRHVPQGRDFARRLSQAAADLAEYQNEEFGDRHDPDEAARGARILALESIARFNAPGPRA